MISASEPIIQNIKVGFRYEVKNTPSSSIRERLQQKNSKNLHNFSVLRDKFVYSIFWTGGYVNITGIRNANKIQEAQNHIIELLNLDCRQSAEIHNICASGKLSKAVNLERIRDYVSNNTKDKVILNLSFFPALFIKVRNFGTCVLYRNGKYSLVAVRKFEDLIPFISYIRNLICVSMRVQ